ncbi:gamma-aminobutyric acid receptor alpha-like isoform X2 [Folsomia candida]|uniref:gamma-aminobutyric acid receptor alpha-like isoform X2 n=1 Tax=Folsomia candida TaxID=158441 RepID=UPI0016055159|nr:gamma-aminobutyric acid receptor alpha-like isoform X2 [Folsomia candida]
MNGIGIILWWISLLFYSLSFVVCTRSDPGYKNNNHKNVSELLDNLLRGYDNSIRPDFGGPPTIVEIDIMVRSMGPISEVDMTYSMDCYFRQTWVDKRLEYHSTKGDTLALSISMLEKIWKPDTYFYNGKQSYLHTITTPNKFVRLKMDGRVLYSSRLTVKASCPMNLEDFPMDTQRCPLKLGSFGYTISDVLYRWNANRTVDIALDMKMSQFDLISTPSGNGTEKMKLGDHSILEATFYMRRHTGFYLIQIYFPCILLVFVSWVGFWINREATADRVTLGEYSTLDINFYLQRHMGNFLIQVYGPCTLLVILSWVSFWLNREATADRVSLGVTTVLTMTFLGLEARTDLPKVSYPTALDFFVFLSFAFIFATIIQFAIVHFHTKYGSGEVYFNEDSSSEEDDDDSGSEDPNRIRSVGNLDIRRDPSVRSLQMSIIEVPPPPRLNNGGMGGSSSSGEGRTSSSMRNPPTPPPPPNWASFCRKQGRKHFLEMESVNSVSKVDQFARVFFPVSFLAINVFYWYSYLYKNSPHL